MIKSKFLNNSLFNASSLKEGSNRTTFFYPCKTKYQCAPFNVQLSAGVYLLECWGASGSTGIGVQGGYGNEAAKWRTGGGYSRGILTVRSDISFHIYIGSSPINGDSQGGYNGGGPDVMPNKDQSYGGGGGATDFRVYNGICSDVSSLKSRFLVSGGSGGSHEQIWGRGGYGGGFTASNALNEGENAGYYNSYAGFGGSQTEGGIAKSAYCTKGSFGIGGKGCDGGGGGGGWYGGGGGYAGIGGGGGSGFGFTKETTFPDDFSYEVPTKYQLKDMIIISGDQTFAQPSGHYSIGNFGDGAARISIITRLHIKTINCNSISVFNFISIFFFIFIAS